MSFQKLLISLIFVDNYCLNYIIFLDDCCLKSVVIRVKYVNYGLI